MGKLIVSYNKSLKLSNVCIREIVESDLNEIDKIIFQMENYIKSKGARPQGPLVQRMFVRLNEDGSADFKTQLMIQATAYINKLEPPYFMEAVHRCRNCLFVRFSGEENQLKYAYDKLNLIAFEEDIPLTGTSYTIFTSKDADTFSADVFMEKKCSPMLPPL